MPWMAYVKRYPHRACPFARRFPGWAFTSRQGVDAHVGGMTFAEALSTLYAASGVAACACYVPQLTALIRRAEARRAMSLASWTGWLGLGVVGIFYAAMVVGQAEMILVSGLNVLCQTMVVGLVAAQRWRDHTDKRAGTSGAGPVGAGCGGAGV